MTHIRHLILYIAILMGAITAQGQTDAMLTHYFAVPTYYNPAAAGDTDRVRLRGGTRMQWVGIDGAPTTFVVAADSPFKLFGRKWGVGAVVQQESLGLYRNLTADVQLGWKKNMLKGTFTAALQVGLINEKFRGSEVFIPDGDDYHQGTDQAIPTTDVDGMALDLGLGVYFSHPKFWAGISATHLNSPTITFTSREGGAPGAGEGEIAKNFEFQAKSAFYLMAGSNIAVKNTLFEILPSMLVSSSAVQNLGLDVTLRARYNKFLSAGLAYRYPGAVSVLLGAEIKGFYLGYSYDYPLDSALARASSGSHEIFAGYSLRLDFSEKNRNRHKSIRIM